MNFEEGYFYKFDKLTDLAEYRKLNKIKYNDNLFLCCFIDNNKYFFHVFDALKEDYDKDYHLQQKINNKDYLIDLIRKYKVPSNMECNYFSKIKHGQLVKKCVELHDKVKDDYKIFATKKYLKHEYYGCFVTVMASSVIYDYYSNKTHISFFGESYLIIGEENNKYIGLHLLSNKCKNSKTLLVEKLQKRNVYKYVKISDACLIDKKDFYEVETRKFNAYSLMLDVKKYKKVLEEQRNKVEIKKKIDVHKNTINRKNNVKKSKENKKNYIQLKNIEVKVKSKVSKCMRKDHISEECLGLIKYVSKEGFIFDYELLLFHCINCNEYSISKIDYDKLRKKGHPLCKIILEDEINNSKYSSYYGMNEESELHTYGYNVNKVYNLSDEQRQVILSFILDNELMDKSDIIDHLAYLINRSIGQKKFNDAIHKWTADREYIKSYKISKLDKYNIQIMKVKK